MIQILQKNEREGQERLLLLNPLGSDAGIWKMIEKSFEDFEICLCEYPGYGDNPYEAYDSFETLADDLIQQIGKMNNKPLHIVGFSFGSWLAQHLVYRPGDLDIRSMTLIGSSEKIYTHGLEMMKSWMEVYQKSGIDSVIKQFALWSFYTKTFDVIPNLMDIYLKKTLFCINNDKAIINQIRVGTKFTTALDMSAIGIRCLILRGQHDFLYPKFCSDILNKRIKKQPIG
jgi:pimeloyl-ACP methyl ester carboxylesterase